MTRRLRIEEGWFTLFLVWAMVMTTAAAILQAELIPGLESTPFLATLGVLAGLALAKSRFRSRTAHLMALAYGVFLVVFFVGREFSDNLSWQERVLDLGRRQIEWLQKAFSEGSSRDGLIFVLHTSGVFWLLGYTAAWYTFRTPRLWRVVLPSGLVLLSVVYYYYGPRELALFLAFYALIALIYVARTHLVAQERIWRSAAVRYEEDIRFNFLQASFLVALLALAAAWGLPTAQASTVVSDTLGQAGVTERWRGFQDDWTRLFSSLRSYGTGTSDAFRDRLVLGGPRTAGNSLIMDVYVAQPIPYVYWQAVAYDTYTNGGWSISESEQLLHFPDDGPLAVELTALRQEVLQTFINFVPNSGTIYGAPELVNTDRQVFVLHQLDGAGNLAPHGIQSRFVMRQGERYQVVSRYSLADAASLRQASQDYPAWVLERYLQLPDTITPETVALAEQLTAGLNNPFDKAIAVRDYLRRNISYNDQIPAPPDGVEPVHYILFDHQEAYCNYYASAMAVMLRSQGIPARFVGGYAQGEWDQDTNSYRVRASNSHTWVEIFFPGYGWIQFEPTAALPTADRPESGNAGDAFGAAGLAPLDPSQDLGLLEDDVERFGEVLQEEAGTRGADSQVAGFPVWQTVAGVVILAVAAGAVYAANLINQRVESNVEKSYGRLENWARWLGLLFRPAQTPYERANLMAVAVPEGREPLRSLTHQYVRQRFSSSGAADEGFDPRSEWRRLRPMLLRRALKRRLGRAGRKG
ncbi:MAG: DUF4129 domain-containing transglutaminase family protein [Candidatus Promineifilaceae bacterium]